MSKYEWAIVYWVCYESFVCALQLCTKNVFGRETRLIILAQSTAFMDYAL